ncbi:hypothetical protein ACIF8T_11240 [Streptomyces sp. NPDC085946]|uniref:hypothetical protein n=1 Tax=Streptomyces sp. NPDC085946 TaxID=3365744 RepID=UPI0037CD6CAE
MGKGGASIPDEEWERFLREAEAGTPGAPEEPSARARTVARRLREEPAPPRGWRTHEPAPRRRGKGRYVVGPLLAVALLLVALAPGRVVDWFGGGGEGGGTPLAAESERPGEAPATEAAARLPTPERPFRGSPAERWADGTAGIHVPAARATGWMDEERVARALERTRDFLAASGLDPGVLRGERPQKAIALINPHQADVRKYLATAFDEPGRDADPLLLFSRLDPSVRLAGDVVKTRGRVSYREGERGAVEVTADVTYVYPVVRAAGGSDEVARTIVRRETVLSWDDPAKVITEPGTFSLLSYKADIANGGCGTPTGYLTPAFGAERAAGGPAGGSEVDPYDRSTSMDQRLEASGGADCGTATRT